VSIAVKAARAGSQGGASGYVGEGGILSSIGNVARRVGGAALAVATGGGIGGAARAIAGPPPVRVMPGLGPTQIAPPGAPLAGPRAMVQRILPFGETGRGTGCPSGYHPNKSAYYTRQGRVEAGSRCVRNRRRNPLNPRALDRSMGRLASAGKALRSLGFRAPTAKGIAQKGKKKGKR